MSRFTRVFAGVLSILLLLSLILSAFAFLTVRRSFPDTSGEIRAAGLNGPVDVYRDPYGIPHIYASNQHDLFFAQGYVHAQDRFWQMDFWRHIGTARLSEMFGDAQLGADRFLRTMGWARVVQQEMELLDQNSLDILNAYTEGVNAYLADHEGSALSLEYAALNLINAGYEIEPWQPLHSLVILKLMAWDLAGNMDTEIQRAILLKTLTDEQLSDLYPEYPENNPIILSASNNQAEISFAVPPRPWLDNEALSAALSNIRRMSLDLQALKGPKDDGIGSNSWAISGQLTNTGQPFLANDPHLGEQMPSIWYEVGLHCTPKGADCPYDVTGFSFAILPGVIIGHNDRIAWGLTNVGPDVQDLYIERINPENPNQYEINGDWVDMEVVEETIQVAGSDPVPLTVRYTRNGPIISDTYGSLDDFAAEAGIELPAQYAIALRWTALDVNPVFPAVWRLNSAQNWDEFRQAADYLHAPSQNLIYADVDGNIGYQMPGNIPIRANSDGTLPIPGWTDEFQWTGYIPFEELPRTFNPPEEYIITANNPVVGEEYPYLITEQWDYGYRALRITELIQGAGGPIDSAYIQRMQGDNENWMATRLAPLLGQIPMEDTRLNEALRVFDGWDYQDHMDSAPAALFNVFWKHLLMETFQDELPEDQSPGGNSRWFTVVRNILDQPDNPWWDDRATEMIESRDEIMARAFAQAVDELESAQGSSPEGWNWGDLHTTTFHNQSLGESGVSLIEALFNRGPFRTSGGSSIVNATGWSADEVYEVVSLPSMRMIVDLSDLRNSLTIHTTGQSGHAYHPHYIDMANLWRNIEYHPMLWERQEIEANAETHLRLIP